MTINYITNLDVNKFSGGWSGMNHNIHRQLSKSFRVNLVQKINPPYSVKDKYLSKGLKMLGIRRNFPAFTQHRLRRIAKAVSVEIDASAELNFYHGATPWLLTENKVPFATYLDCCFGSYIRVYHRQHTFSKRQLSWLFERESDFLNRALGVFFSSKWALDDAAACYNLPGGNFYVAGLGGGFDTSSVKELEETQYFLFIGLDFFGKGGDKVLEAFREVHHTNPSFKLKIAGQKPPDTYLSVPGVEYVGMFNKSSSVEFEKLNLLFTNAYCLVLPTSRDMTPLVLVEAASAGCPAIATQSFGIPEIVKHNETGLLLDPGGPIKEQLVQAMNEMISNRERREKFADNARTHVRMNFNWDRTGKIITDKIIESLS